MSKAMIKVGMKPTEALSTETALTLLGDDERGELIQLAEGIESVAVRIANAKITTDVEAGKLNDLLGGAKTAAANLEAHRVRLKAPVLAEAQAIDAMYRPSLDMFEKLEKAAKRLLIDHIKAEQEKTAAALRESDRLREEARKKQDEAARQLEAAKNETERAAAEALLDNASNTLIEAHRARPGQDIVTGIRSSFAASSLRGKKVAKIVNIKLVSRELLEQALTKDPKPLEQIVLALFKNGAQNVDGCILDDEDVLATRPGLQ